METWQKKNIVYKKTDEWYIEWQRVTTNDNKWYNEWQRVIRNDSEWYRKWQRVSTSDHSSYFFFFFFQIKEESTMKHSKENFLNLEEDLWRRPIELRAETSTQKEILTVRSRNCRSNCSQIFTKIVFLKILQYSPFNRFVGFKTCNFPKKGLQHRCFPVLESLLKKVSGLEAHKANKRRLQHRCFPVNIAKFLKTAFFVNTLGDWFCLDNVKWQWNFVVNLNK